MGLCCRSLKDARILMKMGLGLVLVGHVNFLLGALVHGTVLRDIKVLAHSSTMEYAISNILALVTGLMAVIGGITAITLSKNMKNQTLKWFLLVVSVVICALGVAAAISILASVITAISNEGSSLLKQCQLSGTQNTYSITYECPFDPTRIYGTTLLLWCLIIVMSLMEVVFSVRCFLACTSFLRLPCPWRKTPKKSRVRVRTPRSSAPSSSIRSPDVEDPGERNDLLYASSPTEETSYL